jgi:multidrug efflux pump
VVDDAIIMLENIHRRMHMGEPPLLAALRGSRQVGMAVVSTTLVLCAAFVPVALMQGSVGSLFKEFAVTMAVSVIFSMFISLTLTPVMCSKLLSSSLDTSKVAQKSEEIFERLKNYYVRVLNQALDAPNRVLIGFAAIVAATGLLFTLLPQEFTPKEDRAQVQIQVRSPEGSNSEYTQRQLKKVMDILKPFIDSGEVIRATENIQGNNNFGNSNVWMADWSLRGRPVADFVAEIQPKLMAIPGAQIIANLPPGLGRSGGGGGPGGGGMMLGISGPTYDDLRVWRDAMMEGLRGNPMFSAVRTNFNETKPQIRIRIDQLRAADLGVSIADISDALQAMLGSRRVTTYVEKGEEYDVILQGQDADRMTPSDVSNIYVRSSTSRALIPLSSLVKLEETSYADSFQRLDRRRSISLFLTPRTDVILGDAIAEVQRIAAERIPSTAILTWRGEAGDFVDNSGSIYFSFALALIVVFLVLAAQFESFIHPVVIMMTVPLAVFGALAGLLLFGQSINLFSQIGIIVLVGLAAKNGILIVEFANQLRDAGRDFRQALVEAAVIRLRPIIMTALATIMGAVPLVIATGAGAEGRRPIGVVIFTGVAFAVVVTLVVVPTFYMLFARKTGSPGRVANELSEYEKAFPANAKGHTEADAGHQPAE